jgi:hypothetical protein
MCLDDDRAGCDSIMATHWHIAAVIHDRWHFTTAQWERYGMG